jgi:hypothetical protein
MQTALLHPHPHPLPLHLDACPLARHHPDRKSDLLQSPESRFLILPPIHLPPQICSESAGTGDIHVQALSRRLSRRFAALSTQLHPPAPTSTRVPALKPQYSHLCRLTALAAQTPEALPRALPDRPPCLSARGKSTITSRYLARRNVALRISLILRPQVTQQTSHNPKAPASHPTAAGFVRHLTEIPTSLHREYAPLEAFKKASTAVAEARIENTLILPTHTE